MVRKGKERGGGREREIVESGKDKLIMGAGEVWTRCDSSAISYVKVGHWWIRQINDNGKQDLHRNKIIMKKKTNCGE